MKARCLEKIGVPPLGGLGRTGARVRRAGLASLLRSGPSGVGFLLGRPIEVFPKALDRDPMPLFSTRAYVVPRTASDGNRTAWP